MATPKKRKITGKSNSLPPALHVPVLMTHITRTSEGAGIGGPRGVLEPATIGAVRDRIVAGIADIVVDVASLDRALSSLSSILSVAATKLASTRLSLETVTVELGVSASGQVGFLGTGAEVGATMSISLELKVK